MIATQVTVHELKTRIKFCPECKSLAPFDIYDLSM